MFPHVDPRCGATVQLLKKVAPPAPPVQPMQLHQTCTTCTTHKTRLAAPGPVAKLGLLLVCNGITV